MKSFKYLFLIAVLSLTSCDDILDIEQPGEVNDDAIFSSIETAQQVLNGVYASFPYTNTVSFVSVWTDEVKLGFSNGGQGIGDGRYSFVMNSQTAAAASLWANHNFLINRANRAILGCEKLLSSTEVESEQLELRDMIAQARYLRALAYTQMLPYFTTDLADDNALGVIVFEDIPSIADKRPRNTNADVYTLINADLEYAQANLFNVRFIPQTDPPVPSEEIRLRLANPLACKAISARIAIYRKQYNQALSLSQDIIDEVPLASGGAYLGIWNDSNLAERIFFINKIPGNNTFAGIWSNLAPQINSNNWFEMARNLYDLLDVPSGDIRRQAFVGPSSNPDPDPDNNPDYNAALDQIIIYKYPGKLGTNYLADFKIFRVSEFYLIKAEAQIALNNLIGASETIKQLRDARYSSPVEEPLYSNQQSAYRDLLLERRKELCYEAQRFIDIKRLGVAAGVSFDRNPRECSVNNSCSFSNTDHRLTLPIPNVELNANPNIQQNPNY